jgi:hypothetical protein
MARSTHHVAILFCLLVLALVARQAEALTFEVNVLGDKGDINPGDGLAEIEMGSGQATLRAAIEEANAFAGPDTINITATGTSNVGAILQITESVAITGPGPTQFAVDAQGLTEIFLIDADIRVDMSGFSVVGGLATGGIGEDSNGDTGAGGGGSGCGGCLYNLGANVYLSNMTFEQCSALGGDGGNAGGGVTTANGGDSSHGLGFGGTGVLGAGVSGSDGGGGSGGGSEGANGGEGGAPGGGGGGGAGGLAIEGSGGVVDDFGGRGRWGQNQIDDGFAQGGGGGGGAGLGGAIFSLAGVVTVIDSTFTENTATGGSAGTGGQGISQMDDGAGKGAAIMAYPGASIAIENCTFDSNAASSDAGSGADNDDTFAVMNGFPGAFSITRVDDNPTAADQVDFLISFTEAVTGFDATDLEIIASKAVTGASIESVTGGPVGFIATVNTGIGSGTLGIRVIDDETVESEATGVPIGGGGPDNGIFDGGEAYTVEKGPRIHSADQDEDNSIALSELLRVVQFFNTGGYACADPPGSTEDGYLAGTGDKSCASHDSDYAMVDFIVDLGELLRLVQFYNASAYYDCPDNDPATEDGYCPGVAP